MVNFNDKEIPVLSGESQGRTATVLTEAQLASVEMRNNATLLPKDAVIEFLDKLVVKAQKRRKTDADDADKNYSILCSVNGKQRFIGLGTFVRRDFNKEGRPFVSPISKDVPENSNVVEFYNAFKDKTLKVIDRVRIQTAVFTDDGTRTDKMTETEYPVLDYVAK